MLDTKDMHKLASIRVQNKLFSFIYMMISSAENIASGNIRTYIHSSDVIFYFN